MTELTPGGALPDPFAPTGLRSRCTVYPARALRVETGALAGDAIGGLDEVVAGDIYVLSRDAVAAELVLARRGTAMTVAAGGAVGRPGARVVPLARHQLMGETGAAVEVLTLDIAGLHVALPLGPLVPGEEYTLLASEAAGAELSGVASVSFARGTRITASTGRQVPVEDLAVGDRILTRDHGPQPIRWIGVQTVRAEGANAPVVIAAGVMKNADDLVLSPDHRLYLYRRLRRADGTFRDVELLVRARHLVDEARVWRDAGGQVDYVHLLFDAHEIIYAAGIPTESLLINAEVLAGLGGELARDATRRLRGRGHTPRPAYEPSEAELHGLDVPALLARAAGVADGEWIETEAEPPS